ncbi:unnamed protein product [Rhizophagus irregularis]|nr:unnamed protein product [Rhizophagus irregularis]CAB5366362.1 unnamed protein product [Rhizophagus irregularis]
MTFIVNPIVAIINETYIQYKGFARNLNPVPVRRSERNKNRVANNERDRRRNEQWANQGQRAQQFYNPVFEQPP